MKKSVTTERAHCQRYQKGEQELEARLLEDGHEYDPQQRQQADDGDGHKSPNPDPHWRRKNKHNKLNDKIWVLFIGQLIFSPHLFGEDFLF